jgi:antirestriction protein ArdC
MPPIESFRDTQSYVAVRAHETVHWTAPAHRVNRDLSRYGKDRSERAREELIAELGKLLPLRGSRDRSRARTAAGSCELPRILAGEMASLPLLQ